MKKTTETKGQNDGGNDPTELAMGVQVEAGLKCGDTFTQRGRRYVVIDGRRLITDDLPPKHEDLKAVEIAEDIDVTEIVPSPYNRKHFNEARLQEMADSLVKTGQLETAVVRLIPFGVSKDSGKFELVAGERRWRGCKLAGVNVLRCHVRELSDSEAAEQLLLSNLEREDLTAMEEATTYQQLLDLKNEEGQPLYSLERIAERVFGNAKKRDRVARTLKLLNLPAKMREAVDSGVVSLHVAFLVGRIADNKSREEAAKAILKPNWEGRSMNVKEATAHIAEHYQVNLKGAKFELEDEALVPLKRAADGDRVCGGACEKKTGPKEERGCPFLAKYNPDFEIASGSGGAKKEATGGTSGVDALTCTNPACYEMKLEALWQRTATEIQTKSKVPLEILPRKKVEEWFSKYHSGLEYDAPVVLLSAQAAHGIGTWEKVLKGAQVPFLLACNRKGEPVQVVNKKLAVASATITHPEAFKLGKGSSGEKPTLTAAEMEKLKAESGASGKTLVALVEKAQKEKEAEIKRKKELENKIETEAQMDALRELQAAMLSKGVCVEALQMLWKQIAEDNYEDHLSIYLGQDPEKDDELIQYPTKMALTTVQLLPLIVVARLMSDMGYRALQDEEDFKQLAKIYGVNFKGILDRVKKAYSIAEKEKDKAAAAKVAEETKKPKKNSSDPSDWTPESEASKATAADDQAKKGAGKKTGGEETLEELVSCEKCGTPNFTKRGLKAHKCKGKAKGANVESPLIEAAKRGMPSGIGEVVSIERAAKDLGLLDDDDYKTKSKEEQAAAIAKGEADYVDCLGTTPMRKAPERKEYDRQRIALKRMVDKILKK
jgi:ParB/RepB/Spo0J family partition protein